jgi:hypothetical protein
LILGALLARASKPSDDYEKEGVTFSTQVKHIDLNDLASLRKVQRQYSNLAIEPKKK